MSAPRHPDLAAALMHGPRGRRLLLEFALLSDRLGDPEPRDDSFSAGVWDASYELDPGKGTSVVRFGIEDDSDDETPPVSLSEIPNRLAAVPLAAVTPDRLHDCLLEVVGSARYWQEPEGLDVLAATPELAAPLRCVATHIAASPHVVWWSSPVDMRGQCQVDWDDDPPRPVPSDPAAVLIRDRASTIAAERSALQDRPTDPVAPYSGEWWSNPPRKVPATLRLLATGAPTGLWFVEDDLGWERATSWRLGVPGSLRVYEVDSADAWAALCARFPPQGHGAEAPRLVPHDRSRG